MISSLPCRRGAARSPSAPAKDLFAQGRTCKLMIAVRAVSSIERAGVYDSRWGVNRHSIGTFRERAVSRCTKVVNRA